IAPCLQQGLVAHDAAIVARVLGPKHPEVTAALLAAALDANGTTMQALAQALPWCGEAAVAGAPALAGRLPSPDPNPPGAGATLLWDVDAHVELRRKLPVLLADREPEVRRLGCLFAAALGADEDEVRRARGPLHDDGDVRVRQAAELALRATQSLPAMTDAE